MIDDAFGRLLVAVLIGAAWGRAAALHQQERGNYLPLAAWGLGVGIGAACWEMLGADSAWWWCGAGLLAALAARLLWEHHVDGSVAIKLPATYRFSYFDRDHHPSQRTVRVEVIGQWDGVRYFKGHCQMRHAERTFKADRVRGPLTDMETGEIIEVDALFAGRRLAPLDPTPDAAIRFRG